MANKQDAERAKALLREILDSPVPSVDDFERAFGFPISDKMLAGLTYEKLIHLRAVVEAARGNIKAYSDIQDRLGGKPKQVMEVDHNVKTYKEFLTEIAVNDPDLLPAPPEIDSSLTELLS